MGKSSWQQALEKATFISLDNTHPDWNKQLVELGYSADLLKEQGYQAGITLGAYFSQAGKNVIGLAIPSKNTIYLGEGYRKMNGRDAGMAAAHEILHPIFGTHLDAATAFQKYAGFLPGVDLSKIPDDTLKDQINTWMFRRSCAPD